MTAPQSFASESENPTDEFPALGAPLLTPVRVTFGAMTHVGKVRLNNEDQYLVVRLKKTLEVLDGSLAQGDPDWSGLDSYVFLVADGIGGAGGGERASAFVVQEAKKHLLFTAKWYFRLDDPDEEVRLRLLRESLERIDRTLIEEAEMDPSLAGMGTTLTAAGSFGLDLFVVQVGDSRAYLYRAGQLEQLTRDHTLAQELIEEGLLEPDQAKTHRSRHVLTNAIGGQPGVRGEVLKVRLENGDRLLLSTDGLHDLVSSDRIAEILGHHAEPKATCQALVEAALDEGGRDNITVVVADYFTKEGPE
jgi:serine/threonine protein phosphatase PrpC